MTFIAQNYRANEQIRISPVRLIDEHGEQVGIVETYEALDRAREAGLDLVEMAPNARPPVCRIMDYGKWKYSQKKKHKKHTHEQQLKEVRMRPKTDSHDRMIKLNRARRFFKKGDKVQFTMQFRGRERFHREIAYEIFDGVVKELGEDRVKMEQRPNMEGRRMTMVLSPVKGAFDDVEVTAADEAADAAAQVAEAAEAAEGSDVREPIAADDSGEKAAVAADDAPAKPDEAKQ